MKLLRYIPILLIAISISLAVYFYPHLPEMMSSNWNEQVEAYSTAAQFWVVFLIPIIMTALAGIFALVPRIDPLKANITLFRPYFDGFIVVIFLFMMFIQMQVILWSQGNKRAPTLLLPFGMGLVFYYAGILCTHAKRNWFIGVRTPWTLSSDAVWDKTNKLGGALFKLTGIIAFFGVWFPGSALYLLGIPALLSTVVVVFYSYMEFKNELSTKQSQN